MINIRVLSSEYGVSFRALNRIMLNSFAKDTVYINGRIPKNVVEVIRNKMQIYTNIPTLAYNDIIHEAKSFIPLKIICGVYFLVNENKIVYVGQSINVLGRVTQHFLDKKFDRIFILEINAESLIIHESIYIHKFKPIYNKTIIIPDIALYLIGYILKRHNVLKNMERKLYFGDELEERIALILDKKGINYILHTDNAG